VFCCVLCTEAVHSQAHLDEEFLQFSGLFCHTGPISLCVDSCVFICVYFVFLFHTAYLLYHWEHDGVDLMGLKPNS